MTEENFPESLSKEALEVLSKANKGKLRIGVNEVTKSIERKKAKLVIIAKDVSPAEITMHLPIIAREHAIPVAFVNEKKALGEKAGLKVGSSSIAIVEAGAAEKDLEALLKKMQVPGSKKSDKKLKETPKAQEKPKEEVKKEKPKEEIKTEKAEEKKEGDTE